MSATSPPSTRPGARLRKSDISNPSETRLKGSQPTAVSDPMIGRTIAGRYLVRDCLGAGSMGTVYRARQLPMGREVAFKILHHDHAVNAESKARFLREAQATSSLFSPHTVTVYDFGESDSGELFLAMEALDGESLGARLKRVGAFRPSEAVSVALQVLNSLSEAHQKGIIHRDLKPDNLFFARSRDGSNREVVKVLDFGIAKVLHDEQQRLSPIETAAGTVFGTPRYMSPEQAQGKQLDTRSDLYSLGVMLYHMLVGHPPFTDDDAILVMAHHIKTVPTRPSALGVALSASLENIVMQTLSKRPSDRPATAAALIDLLTEAVNDPDEPLSGHASRRLDDEPSRAHPLSFPPVTSSADATLWKRRPTFLIALGVGLLLGGLAAGVSAFAPKHQVVALIAPTPIAAPLTPAATVSVVNLPDQPIEAAEPPKEVLPPQARKGGNVGKRQPATPPTAVASAQPAVQPPPTAPKKPAYERFE